MVKGLKQENDIPGIVSKIAVHCINMNGKITSQETEGKNLFDTKWICK